MSRQSSAEPGGRVESQAGPGAAFQPFIVMDALLDKLKLLNYEADFTAQLRMKPLNRHYFVLQVFSPD